MKRIPLLFALIAIAYGLSAAAVVYAQQEVEIARSASTTVTATLARRNVVVQIRTTKLGKSDAGFPSSLSDYQEVSVVPQLSISVDGQDVWVPRSAYADLFNPRKALVKYENGFFVLLIGGADGADSYSAHLRFTGTRVVDRTVYNTVSPPRVSEKTVYSKTEIID